MTCPPRRIRLGPSAHDMRIHICLSCFVQRRDKIPEASATISAPTRFLMDFSAMHGSCQGSFLSCLFGAMMALKFSAHHTFVTTHISRHKNKNRMLSKAFFIAVAIAAFATAEVTGCDICPVLDELIKEANNRRNKRSKPKQFYT